MSPENSEVVKSIADGVAVAGTVGVVIKILSVIASETVKKLTGRD